MTLSEQERTGSSVRAEGDGPGTAEFPTQTADGSAFETTSFSTAGLDTTWFSADRFRAYIDDHGSPDEADDAEPTSVVPAYDDAEPTSVVPVYDDAEPTSVVPVYDDAEPTSVVPAYDDVSPAETTSRIPAFGAAHDDPETGTTVLDPVTTAAPVETPDEAPAPAPQMVVGSRGVRRPASAASAGSALPADVAAPPTTPPRSGSLLGSGSRGVMMRLLLVLVLLSGAVGAVAVTRPQILAGFGTSTGTADGPLTTLAPSPPEVTGIAPPGGLLPGMPLPPPMPLGAPVGAPPPMLPPGPLGGPAGVLPPGAVAPPASLRGLGIGDVVGALFDSAQGDFASHFDNSGGPGLIESGYYPSVVRNPQAPARGALQFALDPGGKRSEVLPVGPGTQPVDGEQQFVRYSSQLSPNFPTSTADWQILLQWHHRSPDGSPPLALEVDQGALSMVSGGDDRRFIGPISPGEPINLTMQIAFSMDPSQASVTVWRDGRPTGVSNWHPYRGTMFTPGAYLKMGMYRSQSIGQGGAVTVTDLKIGRSPNAIGGLGPLVQR